MVSFAFTGGKGGVGKSILATNVALSLCQQGRRAVLFDADLQLANLDVMEREDLNGRVRAHEGEFRAALDTLLDLPIVAEIRGMGYFYGIELTNDGVDFTDDECEWLIRGFLSTRLLENGLICRADDRGDPVIQLSPPLIAGPEEFEQIASIIRLTLEQAWKELGR